jgi:hypothetical protein
MKMNATWVCWIFQQGKGKYDIKHDDGSTTTAVWGGLSTYVIRRTALRVRMSEVTRMSVPTLTTMIMLTALQCYYFPANRIRLTAGLTCTCVALAVHFNTRSLSWTRDFFVSGLNYSLQNFVFKNDNLLYFMCSIPCVKECFIKINLTNALVNYMFT